MFWSPYTEMMNSVNALDGNPKIVSISDVHGYFEEGRSALLTLRDHPDFEPVVETDSDGRLTWSDNDYVLVFNGDMVDRGPYNEECVDLVERLQRQAPEGRVRYHVGNHEEAVFFPDLFSQWSRWYSVAEMSKRYDELCDSVIEERISVAYEGYNYTYVHAGAPDEIDAHELNTSFTEAVQKLKLDNSTDNQERVFEEHDEVFGIGGSTGRGPGAGVVWLDFKYMPEDAPPQIVGHSRHDAPEKKGNVICQNVIRNNRRRKGGEAVLVEDEEGVEALIRGSDGDVKRKPM